MARLTIDAIGDRMSLPVFLLGTDRYVMYSNPAANAILDGRFRLKLHGGRLLVTDSTLLSRFETAVDSLLTSIARASHAAVPLPAAQTTGKAMLHLSSARTDGSDHTLIGMINCVRELGQEELRRLRQTLGLSKVEAQIAAALLAGCSPREIARRRNSSEQTVRWHIKNLHSKTQTRRLTELVLQIQSVRSPF